MDGLIFIFTFRREYLDDLKKDPEAYKKFMDEQKKNFEAEKKQQEKEEKLRVEEAKKILEVLFVFSGNLFFSSCSIFHG